MGKVQLRLAQRSDVLQAAVREIDRPVLHHMNKRVDPISYYLRGRVYCRHCGMLMTPAGHHGATTKIGYYECHKPCKTGQKCPIARVNANSLHEVVDAAIIRMAEHPSRFDRLWRDVIREMPKPKDISDEMARVKRNRRETEKKQTRLIEAIKAGVPAKTLAGEIQNLEELASTQDQKIDTLWAQLRQGQVQRPDMDALRSLWEQWRDNAAYLSEEEKTELLGLLVGPVTLTERTEEGVTAKISLLLTDDPPELSNVPANKVFALKLQNPRSNVEDRGYLSARARPGSNHGSRIRVPFDVYSGGMRRIKIPRGPRVPTRL